MLVYSCSNCGRTFPLHAMRRAARHWRRCGKTAPTKPALVGLLSRGGALIDYMMLAVGAGYLAHLVYGTLGSALLSALLKGGAP